MGLPGAPGLNGPMGPKVNFFHAYIHFSKQSRADITTDCQPATKRLYEADKLRPSPSTSPAV